MRNTPAGSAGVLARGHREDTLEAPHRPPIAPNLKNLDVAIEFISAASDGGWCDG